jgi:hypothetical protein
MMVASLGAPDDEMEALLPWHATGALDRGVISRIDELLGRDTKLAAAHREIRDEMAETVSANEELGAPSPQTMDRLFAAIDAEPARSPSQASGFAATMTAFFASLTPRTLMYSASVAALAFIVQGGVIGSLMLSSPVSDRSAITIPVTASAPAASAPAASAPAASASGMGSVSSSGSVTRSLGGDLQTDNGVRMQIRFAEDARISDIAQFLSANAASVVAGPKAGTFTVRFGNTAMSKDDIVTLVKSLERERIVSAISIAQ